jgi:hypothetical protein
VLGLIPIFVYVLRFWGNFEAFICHLFPSGDRSHHCFVLKHFMLCTGVLNSMYGSLCSLGPTLNVSFTTSQHVRYSPGVFTTTGVLLGKHSSNSPSSICPRICFTLQMSF